MNRIFVSYNDWITFILTGIIFLIGIGASVLGYPEGLSICATVVNLLFIIKFRKVIPVFILFSFIFLYTKTFNIYFIDHIGVSFWQDFQTPGIINTVLINHAIFLVFLGNLISAEVKVVKTDLFHHFEPDRVLFSIFLVFSIFILIFGLTGETIFQSGSYGTSDTVQKSTLHEYFILIFLFVMLFAPRNFACQSLLIFILLLYMIKTLLYGGRIEVVQVSLLFFYLYYVFKDKIKLKYVVLIIFSGIYFNEVVSNIRTNPADLIQGNIGQLMIPSGFFSNNNDIEYIASNEGDVIQSSARLIGLSGTAGLTPLKRGFSFISYLFSPIVPLSILPGYANLAAYEQDTYRSGGGGLISTYFFIWLGYIGPAIIAAFLAFVIRSFYQFENKLMMIYGVLLLITFPRWFAYNPVLLVKFCFYGVILYLLIRLFILVLKKRQA